MILDILGGLGGLMLILGSFLLYKGKIFFSMIAYLIADLCWFGISIESGGIFGSVAILIGIIFSVGTWFKMNKGIFYKDLRKENG